MPLTSRTRKYLCSRSCKEVIDFFVDINGAREILWAADLGFDKVITVHSCRNRRRRHSGRHELEQCHLRNIVGLLESPKHNTP